MVVGNRERVGRALELLGVALGRYVDRGMTRHSPAGGNWKAAYAGENVDSDASTLISVILDNWQPVFRDDLRVPGRTFLSESRTWRNHWAHNNPYSDPDTDRALDTFERLLRLMDVPEADEVGALRAMPRTQDEAEDHSSIPQSPTRVEKSAGPVKPRGPAQQAIRSSMSKGGQLFTPGRHKPFWVGNIDDKSVVLLFGNSRTPTRFTWECLEGVVSFLSGKGWVRIGTSYATAAVQGTLDGYLKGYMKRATAGWVAALLKEAGLVEIDEGEALRVRLLD